MSMDADERAPMLSVHSIGPKMISYLEAIDVTCLSDIRGADAQELALRINVALGRRHINRMGVAALENLIAFANGT